MFAVKPGPIYPDAARAFRTDLEQWEAIIDRVTDLFLRMKTQEAEIAATVHFTGQSLVHQTKGEVSEIAIFEAVKQWKQNRHPPLKDEEIAQAIRDLNVLDWIRAQVSEDLPLPRAALVDL